MTAAADPTKLKRIVAKPVEIREMEIGDLADVYELGEELFTAERWPSLYRTWDQYELATHFAADSETCLVAEDNDKVVGFIVGSVHTVSGTAAQIVLTQVVARERLVEAHAKNALATSG